MNTKTLTPRAEESLKYADAFAESLGHSYIGSEHLLMGILMMHRGVAFKILDDSGVTEGLIRKAMVAGMIDVDVGVGGMAEKPISLTIKDIEAAWPLDESDSRSLDTYNQERRRGIVHSEKWKETMADFQKRRDVHEAVKQRSKAYVYNPSTP